jgi:hypothetical protein
MLTESSIGLARICAIAALALAGCDSGKDKDQAFKGCRFEVMKMYPGEPVDMSSTAPMQVREAVAACMSSKGFKRDASDSTCQLSQQELQAACYQR